MELELELELEPELELELELELKHVLLAPYVPRAIRAGRRGVRSLQTLSPAPAFRRPG